MTAAEAVEFAPRLEYMLTLDAVAYYVKHTVLNPLIWYGLWLGQGLTSGRWQSYSGCGAAILVLFSALQYANRVYSCAGSRLFLPKRVSAKGRVSWMDQIVLITGGGSGIGAFLAEVLADRGATVVILTKFPPVHPIEKRDVHTYICDVSDWKAVQDVAGVVQKEVGDPTMIINNAGIVKGKLLLDLTEDDVLDTFGANTIAHYWTLKAFLPAMLKKGRGHVVSVASILGIVGTAQMTDYCASKAAVISLHQSLRQELDNRTPQIRTTLVLPSHITTSLFSSIHLPSRGIWSFIAPPLTPHMVVRAIVAALDSDTSTIIRLPFYAQLLRVWGPAVGILPKPLVDVVQWVVGADTAMRGYGPRPDAAERLHSEIRGEQL